MLKYLFAVLYRDGSVYEQNAEDVSLTDKKRSCFFDVKQDEVKVFELTDGTNYFSVDLDDGHFEVNGIPFYLHDKAMPLTKKRLIFFRQHTHQFNTDKVESSHEVMYRFGWQANDEKGKNVQHIIEVE